MNFRKFFLLFLSWLFWGEDAGAQNENNKTIDSLFKKLSNYSYVYDSLRSNNADINNASNIFDSIFIINQNISKFILQKYNSFNKNTIKAIEEAPYIRHISSRDEKLNFICWNSCLGGATENYITLASCKAHEDNNIFFFSPENMLGEASSVDSIVEIDLPRGSIYMVMRSNKCGSLCIYKRVEAYTIKEGNIIKMHAFSDGVTCFEEVELTYLVDSDLGEQSIGIANKSVFVPIINEEKNRIIATKKYSIELCDGE